MTQTGQRYIAHVSADFGLEGRVSLGGEISTAGKGGMERYRGSWSVSGKVPF